MFSFPKQKTPGDQPVNDLVMFSTGFWHQEVLTLGSAAALAWDMSIQTENGCWEPHVLCMFIRTSSLLFCTQSAVREVVSVNCSVNLFANRFLGVRGISTDAVHTHKFEVDWAQSLLEQLLVWCHCWPSCQKAQMVYFCLILWISYNNLSITP
jgi:hypothetical protein